MSACEGLTKAGKPCSRQAKAGEAFCAQHVDQADGDSMAVVAAVERDLADIASRKPSLAKSGLAASALALAREIDGDNSATSKSMCAKSLIETLDRLRDLAPAAKENDELDELRARRASRRLERSTAAAN